MLYKLMKMKLNSTLIEKQFFNLNPKQRLFFYIFKS